MKDSDTIFYVFGMPYFMYSINLGKLNERFIILVIHGSSSVGSNIFIKIFFPIFGIKSWFTNTK